MEHMLPVTAETKASSFIRLIKKNNKILKLTEIWKNLSRKFLFLKFLEKS